MKNLVKMAEELRLQLSELTRKAEMLSFELDLAARDLEASKLVIYEQDDTDVCYEQDDTDVCQYCGYKAAYRIDGHKVCTACIHKIGR